MKDQIMKMDKEVIDIGGKSIDSIESEMLKQKQIECPTIHRFGPGTYIREVNIPAGTLAVGHHQNNEHTNIMLKGRVTMLNDDGTTSELKAPMIFIGRPGRKIGFIHEDIVWLNVYPNVENEQSIEKLEAKHLTKSEGFKLADEKRDQLLLASKSYDEKDFEQALIDLGVSKEQVKIQSENTDDMVDLPHGAFKIKAGKSPIHGQGIFATADIYIGETIGPGRIGEKRTILGRFTNHALYPNSKFVKTYNGRIDLVATERIFGCRGGFNGDEITVDYREAVKLNLEIAGGLKCQA